MIETLESRLCLSATITGVAVTDQGSDGVFDPLANDSHRAGVTVQLWNPVDGIVGNSDDLQVGHDQVTAWNGHYSFADLAPGAYYVRFLPPQGGLFSPKDVGSDDIMDSDVDSETGCTDIIVLAEGQFVGNCNALMYELASLAGRVTFDDDGNVGFEEGDAPINGITVGLYEYQGGSGNQPNGRLVAEITTDSDGRYAFTGIKPRTYYLKFSSPDGMVLALVGGVIPRTERNYHGISHPFAMPSGQQVTQDALFVRAGAIGGTAWRDLNGDGVRQMDEPSVAGATVRLFRSYQTSIHPSDPQIGGDVVTDADGRYVFAALPWGDYYVRFMHPAGLTTTPANIGLDDAIDSDAVYDADLISSSTSIFYLPVGGNSLSVDAGFAAPAAVGGVVWHDLNRNGIRDTSEPGLFPAPVTLVDTVDGVAGNYGDRGVAFAYTNASGEYRFDNLPSGTYYIRFSAFWSYCDFSPANQGDDDAADSDAVHVNTWFSYADTDNLAVGQGQQNLTFDAGLYRPGPGPSGITLSPSTDTGISNSDRLTHLDNGPGRALSFMVQGTTPGAQVILLADGWNPIGATWAAGSSVVVYTDGLTDLADGTHQISAVQVPLGYAWSNPCAPVAITVDTTGPAAEVVDIEPDPRDTPLGEAVVTFGEDVYGSMSVSSFSLFRDGGQNLLQGVSGLTVSRLDSRSFKLNGTALSYLTSLAGAYTLRVDPSSSSLTDAAGNPAVMAASGDFTVENLGAVKTTAWVDRNFDGVRSLDEPLYSYGFSVSLYSSDDEVIGNQDDRLVASGQPYQTFMGLRPGWYYAVFAPPKNNLIFTTPDAGAEESADSDADPVTGRTGLFTVVSGQICTDITAGVFPTSFYTQGPSTFTLSRQGDWVEIVETMPRMPDRIHRVLLERLPSLEFLSAGSMSTVRINLAGGSPIPAGGISYSSVLWSREVNSIELLGDGTNMATCLPGPAPVGQEPPVSRLIVDGREIELKGVPEVVASGFARFATITPAGRDTLTLDIDTAGRRVLTGTVGTTRKLPPVHAAEVREWTLDLIANDSMPATDTLTIRGTQTPAMGRLRAILNGGDSVRVEKGETELEIVGPAALTATGEAAVNLHGLPTLAAITTEQNAILRAVGDESQVLRTAGLAIRDLSALDLGVGNLIVDSGNEQASLAAYQQVISAIRRAGPAWQSLGLTSTAAREHPAMTLAAIRAGSIGHFAGQSVNALSILVGYTCDGDADLNGIIDADDYFRIDQGCLRGLAGYREGDFDYSGGVDADDYHLIDAAFLAQNTAPAAAWTADQASRIPDYTSSHAGLSPASISRQVAGRFCQRSVTIPDDPVIAPAALEYPMEGRENLFGQIQRTALWETGGGDKGPTGVSRSRA